MPLARDRLQRWSCLGHVPPRVSDWGVSGQSDLAERPEVSRLQLRPELLLLHLVGLGVLLAQGGMEAPHEALDGHRIPHLWGALHLLNFGYLGELFVPKLAAPRPRAKRFSPARNVASKVLDPPSSLLAGRRAVKVGCSIRIRT